MSNKEVLTSAMNIAIRNGWAGLSDYPDEIEAETIIYNKQFAKALWGDADIEEWSYDDMTQYAPAWQYHLREMVIADDPIKYLGENLPA